MGIQAKGDFSPKLKMVMKEVGEVLKKHDVGAFFVLNDGDGHGEYRMFLEEPTWSVIRFMPDGNIHIKAHMKSNPVATDKTINMVFNQRDILGQTFLMMNKLRDQLKTMLNVEETEGKMTHER